MPGAAGSAVTHDDGSVEGLPARLRLNQLQLLGSHNSYKRYPSAEADARIRTLAPEYWDELNYGHPPLEAQLAIGIRQIEIDVAPDPQGGLYATPYLMAPPDVRLAMTAPGAKVLHVPEIDTETHCLTFRDCLAVLRRWSDRHPGHVPVTVLVNASDLSPVAGLWLRDARFEAADLDALDTDIRAVMGEARLISPDTVRGDHATLAAAVRAHGWPTLAAAKGRFLFVLDGNGRHYAVYRDGHPSLAGRAMFGFYDEQSAEAAIFNIQDARGAEPLIRRLVPTGFLVRSRADADTVEARANDVSRLHAATGAGAQFVSTDYYDGAPNPHGYPYSASLPEDIFMRCNPVSAHCDRHSLAKLFR